MITRSSAKLGGLVLAMLSIVLLAACTSSLNPVGPLEEAVPAPELLGTWVAEGCADEKPKPGESVYLHIMPLKEADAKQLEIVALELATGGTGSDAKHPVWYVTDGYVTALPNGRLINLRLVATGPENLRPENAKQLQKFPYFFATYRFNTKHQLVTSFSVMSAVRDAANGGGLADDCGGVNGDVCVTDGSASIASYLGSLDQAALFKDQCIYRKVE